MAHLIGSLGGIENSPARTFMFIRRKQKRHVQSNIYYTEHQPALRSCSDITAQYLMHSSPVYLIKPETTAVLWVRVYLLLKENRHFSCLFSFFLHLHIHFLVALNLQLPQ